MWPQVLLSIYCILVIAASLAGGWLPALVPLRQRGMQMLMCLVAGLMMGVAILHLLPHSLHETGNIDITAIWCLAGLLVMWALVRLFHFHQHVEVTESGEIAAVDCDHGHDHQHSRAHHHHERPSVGRYDWLGVAFGLGIHTFIDGVAVGAAVVADAGHAGAFPIYGLGIFLAVLLHKPMDALAVTALMAAAGWSKQAQTMVNAGFAMMCPIGAVLVMAGVNHAAAGGSMPLGCALAFSAGVFLWISLGDLLPDVHFHSRDAAKFAVALMIGVAIAYGIGFLEGHNHGAGDVEAQTGHEHSP